MSEGFDVAENGGDSPIVGKLVRFNKGSYIVGKDGSLPPGLKLLVRSMVTCWVRWSDDGKPDYKITQPGQSHPERDELPDQDDSLWPPGPDDKPSDPWRDTRLVLMVDQKTATQYSFTTDSAGGRRAVRELKNQIALVREEHPTARPIVEMVTGSMPSKKYGKVPAPEFKVLDWHKGRGANGAALPPSRHDGGGGSLPSPRPRPGGDMDDEIPFSAEFR
jgi:hypothetical protein